MFTLTACPLRVAMPPASRARALTVHAEGCLVPGPAVRAALKGVGVTPRPPGSVWDGRSPWRRSSLGARVGFRREGGRVPAWSLGVRRDDSGRGCLGEQRPLSPTAVGAGLPVLLEPVLQAG